MLVLSFGVVGCSSNGSSNSGGKNSNINPNEIIKNYEKYQTWSYSETQYGHIKATDYSSSIHKISERYISASLDVVYTPNSDYEETKHMVQFCFVDVSASDEIQTPSVDPKLQKVGITFNDTESYSVPIYSPEGNSFALISDNAKFVINKLKTSKTCAITVKTVNGQNLRFEFNTEGLNWQY